MTTQPILESGMKFGPYPAGECFYIEQSQIYTAINPGVKIAEFLWLRTNLRSVPALWVVEAKSSTPRPETQPNFDAFIEEISVKLRNAFSLTWASCLKRHPHTLSELPIPFQSLDLSQTDVRFILVIKGHQDAWLPPIQEALKKSLYATVQTWRFSPTSVAVINDVMAKECGLIH